MEAHVAQVMRTTLDGRDDGGREMSRVPRNRRGALVALAVGLLVATTPLPAFAEVMDKEPSLAAIWLSAVLCGALGFALGRFRVYLAPAALLVAVATPLGSALSELQDALVRLAIWHEAGAGYALQVYAAGAVMVALCAAGVLLRVRSVRKARTLPPSNNCIQRTA